MKVGIYFIWILETRKQTAYWRQSSVTNFSLYKRRSAIPYSFITLSVAYCLSPLWRRFLMYCGSWCSWWAIRIKIPPIFTVSWAYPCLCLVYCDGIFSYFCEPDFNYRYHHLCRVYSLCKRNWRSHIYVFFYRTTSTLFCRLVGAFQTCHLETYFQVAFHPSRIQAKFPTPNTSPILPPRFH